MIRYKKPPKQGISNTTKIQISLSFDPLKCDRKISIRQYAHRIKAIKLENDQADNPQFGCNISILVSFNQ